MPVSEASNGAGQAVLLCHRVKSVEQNGLADPSQADRHDALAGAPVDRASESDAVVLKEGVAAYKGGGLGPGARRKWVLVGVD